MLTSPKAVHSDARSEQAMEMEGTIRWKYAGAKEWGKGPERVWATMLPNKKPHIIQITFDRARGSRSEASLTVRRRHSTNAWAGAVTGDERNPAIVIFDRQSQTDDGMWTLEGIFTETEVLPGGTTKTCSGVCEMHLSVK
jgi:hypothetical protein